MARGFLSIYRTYNMIDKDKAIDEVRTILQDEGLFKNLRAVSEISSVSVTTLDNWFHGDTKRPMNATLQAVITSMGYKTEYTKDHQIDVEKERKLGKAWLKGRAEAREKAHGPNGRKPRKAKKRSA